MLVRQRPGNGKAIFLTLEDESGIANIILWADTFEKYRSVIMSSRLLIADGIVQQSKEGVCHLMASRLYDRTADLDQIANPHRAAAALPPLRGSHPRDVPLHAAVAGFSVAPVCSPSRLREGEQAVR